MRKSLVTVGAALAVLGCRSEQPEAAVRRAFDACRAAIEAGEAAPVIERLHPDFRGPDGMDRATARLTLLGILRQGRVGLTVLSNEVVVAGPEAQQEVDLLVTSHGSGLLPQDASRQAYRLTWRKVGGAWRLAALQPR